MFLLLQWHSSWIKNLFRRLLFIIFLCFRVCLMGTYLWWPSFLLFHGFSLYWKIFDYYGLYFYNFCNIFETFIYSLFNSNSVINNTTFLFQIKLGIKPTILLTNFILFLAEFCKLIWFHVLFIFFLYFLFSFSYKFWFDSRRMYK